MHITRLSVSSSNVDIGGGQTVYQISCIRYRETILDYRIASDLLVRMLISGELSSLPRVSRLLPLLGKVGVDGDNTRLN